MPTYEYKCDNGHVFDVLQSISEDPLETCEVCGAPARRVLHAPAVHFKGSGFYTTDYGKKGSKAAANGGGSSSESSKSESKSESSSGDSSGGSDSSTGSSSKSDSGSTATASKD